MFKNIVLGISGGVDSAVSALLLKNRGYNVQAIFMQNWDIADEKGHCSSEQDFQDAQEACDILNIPLTSVNFVKHFWNEVFCHLMKEYQSGFTPNPDIVCNQRIKFNHFFDYAINNLKADAIATGHYARTSFGPYLEKYKSNEKVQLLQAVDLWKDQTLFLSQINQNALQRTMFPVGTLTKNEVKRIASDNGLQKFSQKKESMGICFIGNRKFQNFISEYIEDDPGDFVDIDTGRVVGHHRGVHQWTLGQRAKIGGCSEAFFTVAKNLENNVIYVAQGTNHSALYNRLIFTFEPHWIHSKPEELEKCGVLDCGFKFQHVETIDPCVVCQTDKGLIIKLWKSKRSLTPGQYAVLYKGSECLGSAKILFSPTNFILDWLKNNEMSRLSKSVEKYSVEDKRKERLTMHVK